jgi:hypothetical protein
MPRSPDLVTRRVRFAANAAAVAVVVFAVLWFATTQIESVRAVSPFAEDPYDLFASFAALFLPLVAGATWVRSLAHREPQLATAVARRIVLGSGIALAIVAVAVGADVVAMVATPTWPGPGGAERGLIVWLALITAVVTVLAAGLLVGAVVALRRPATVDFDTDTEPDVVDDALGLAVEVGALVRLGQAARRASLGIERFLERSPASPRRHRVGFGVVLALASAVAFVVWHAIREGPWASPAAALVFGLFPAVGILAIYLATLAPLRLLRPPLD